jgi:hypothetical protein
VFNQATTLLQGLIASNRRLHPQLMAVVTPRLGERHRAETRR